MRTLAIMIPIEQIVAFCRCRPIARLSLFGSILRDDFTPQSDVDFLVEFRPGSCVGIFELTRMESELGQLMGRRVDLRTPLELSKRFRGRITADSKPIYVKDR
jgi:predicted nucleotidyltransferase